MEIRTGEGILAREESPASSLAVSETLSRWGTVPVSSARDPPYLLCAAGGEPPLGVPDAPAPEPALARARAASSSRGAVRSSAAPLWSERGPHRVPQDAGRARGSTPTASARPPHPAG